MRRSQRGIFRQNQKIELQIFFNRSLAAKEFKMNDSILPKNDKITIQHGLQIAHNIANIYIGMLLVQSSYQ